MTPAEHGHAPPAARPRGQGDPLESAGPQPSRGGPHQSTHNSFTGGGVGWRSYSGSRLQGKDEEEEGGGVTLDSAGTPGGDTHTARA